MKKLHKILAALLVFCLTAGALVACGSEEPTEAGKDTYKFTVVDENGTAVTGVKVYLCSTEDGTCYAQVAVDENGYVAYDKMEGYGVYDIHVYGIPEGYEFEEFQTSADTHEYQLVLKKKI